MSFTLLLQAYILGPILASAVGGLVYEFIFNPHYESAYAGIENGEGEEMK